MKDLKKRLEELADKLEKKCDCENDEQEMKDKTRDSLDLPKDQAQLLVDFIDEMQKQILEFGLIELSIPLSMIVGKSLSKYRKKMN